MIPQRNLFLLSNRMARTGGRRIPEAVLERDYCIAWFLAGLSRTSLSERLAFKGGTAIKHCYFGDYRFSEDLDFTLVNETGFETIRREVDDVFAAIRQESAIEFRFAREDRHSHANSYTFYLSYEGPLPAAPARKEIKVDVTIKERIVFSLAKKQALRVYEEYADLPTDAIVQVYTLDEIATEKVVALCDRARNEPRDLYDIWYLMDGRHVDLSFLKTAIAEKLAFRGRVLAGISDELRAKEDRLRRLWDSRLSHQMALLPEFQEVFRAVQREFRRAGLP